MREVELTPLEGIPPVMLGMGRAESRRALKSPFRSLEKSSGALVDAYFEAAFQVFFASDDTVEYIELSNHAGLSAFLFGRNVFATEAQALISWLAGRAELSSEDGGYSYTSRELEVGLWRPVIPESPVDIEGRYFSSIGLG